MANSFNSGLHQNLREHQQPDDTYRYALNMMVKPGSIGALNTEVGIQSEYNFDGNIIGSKNISNDEILLCLQNPDEIILLNTKTKIIKSLIKDPCLNFKNHVHIEHKTLKGCEDIIYMVDGLNDDRVINITDIIKNPTSHNYLNPDKTLNCNFLKEKPFIEYPILKTINVVNSGGSLPIGSYEIILQMEDELGFQTSYFGHSLPFPVSLGPDKDTVSLGQDDLIDPLTSKSISIELGNIDQKYKYINIIIGHTNSNNIKAYFKLTSIPVTENSIIIDSLNRTINVTAEEITIIRNIYDTSKTITQIDNRLIKGNLSSTVFDYSLFQKEANKIKTNYVVKKIEYKEDSQIIPKTESYYLDNKSYLRDEVYDLGIVWVFKNGFETPAFHIPGKTASVKEKKLVLYKLFVGEDPDIEEVTNIPKSEFNLMNFNLGGTPVKQYRIENWKVNNTSKRTYLKQIPKDGGIYSKGEMSYFESNVLYPDVESCSIDSFDKKVYPSGYIRYHKMPSSKVEPFFSKITISPDNEEIISIHPLGIEFNNVVPPELYKDDIQGYYIVRQERTENNRTILDKGIAVNNYMYNIKNPSLNQKWTSFNVQPTEVGNHLFNHAKYSGKYEEGLFGQDRIIDIEQGFIPLYSLSDNNAAKTYLRTIKTDWSNYVNPYTYRCPNCNSSYSCKDTLDNLLIPDLKSVSFYSPLTKVKKPSMISNLLEVEYSLGGSIYELDRDVSGTHGILKKMFKFINLLSANYNNTPILAINKRPYYVDRDLQVNASYLSKPFNNKNAQDTTVLELKERDYHSFQDKLTSSTGTPNATRSPDNTCAYVSLKNYNRNVYGVLSNRTYIKTHTNLFYNTPNCITFGGDIFINKFYILQSAATKMLTRGETNARDNDYQFNDCTTTNNNSSLFTATKTLTGVFVESEINIDLRSIDLQTDEIDNTYFPYYQGTWNEMLNLDYARTEGAKEGTGGFSWYKNGNYFKDKYLYNNAFSEQSGSKKYFSLDSKYNYCSECQEEFPNRITYSEPANEEGIIDNFRIFYANNYKDLPASKGEINKAFINYDYLYVSTERSLYIIPVKNSQLQIESESIFLGNAEFLSAPIKELISTDFGYLGNNQPQSIYSTEVGTLYLDTVSNSIFILGDVKSGPQNISDEKLSDFLKSEMNFYLNDYYNDKYKTNYPHYNQPSIKNGIGFITGYDPKYKRIFITKIDYFPIEDISNLNKRIVEGTIDINDPELFENKSWTLSYSLLTGAFVSYHSYLPNYYITNNIDNYRSVLGNNKLYKQVDSNYRTYFDTNYPSIIDYIIKHEKGVGTLETINYFQKCELNGTELKNETFNNLTVYNSNQSTGRIPIIYKKNPFDSVLNPNSLFITNNEHLWSISKFRDNVTNYDIPLFVKDWEYTKSNYPIDKVINPFAFNIKSPFEKEMLRDLYTEVRLEYKSDKNTNLMIDISIPIIKPSIK
jgi:hypothetical protein